MVRYVGLVIVGLVCQLGVAEPGRPGGGKAQEQFIITDKTLEFLERISEKIHKKAADLERFYVNKLPQTDQARFKEDVAAVVDGVHGTRSSIDSWIEHVKKGGLGPIAPPAAIGAKIANQFIMGVVTTKDRARATAAWTDEFEKNWVPLLKEISGNFYDSSEIGSAGNYDSAKDLGYFLFGSNGSLTVKVDPTRLKEVKGTITGGDKKGAGDAYPSWRDACFKWLRTQKKEYKERMVGGTCNSPSNLSRDADIGYYQWSSQGVVFIVAN